MAPRQQVDPTAPPPPTQQQPSSVANPLGVPFYDIDPATGQPRLDANGQPKRWSATVTPDYANQLSIEGAGPVRHVPPRYFDGSQWMPASLPPDQIAKLQQMMVWAGLGKSTDFQLGVWDQNSMQAYSQLLGEANASGTDAVTALKTRAVQRKAHPPDTSSLPTQVTNPEDLKKVFRTAFGDLLGVGVSEDKLNQMVSAYQQQETTAQQQKNQADAAGTGGSIVQAPSPTTFAEDIAKQENPGGVAANNLVKQGGVLEVLANAFKGYTQ